jgi:hypothetical protein
MIWTAIVVDQKGLNSPTPLSHHDHPVQCKYCMSWPTMMVCAASKDRGDTKCRRRTGAATVVGILDGYSLTLGDRFPIVVLRHIEWIRFVPFCWRLPRPSLSFSPSPGSGPIPAIGIRAGITQPHLNRKKISPANEFQQSRHRNPEKPGRKLSPIDRARGTEPTIKPVRACFWTPVGNELVTALAT